MRGGRPVDTGAIEFESTHAVHYCSQALDCGQDVCVRTKAIVCLHSDCHSLADVSITASPLSLSLVRPIIFESKSNILLSILSVIVLPRQLSAHLLPVVLATASVQSVAIHTHARTHIYIYILITISMRRRMSMTPLQRSDHTIIFKFPSSNNCNKDKRQFSFASIDLSLILLFVYLIRKRSFFFSP